MLEAATDFSDIFEGYGLERRTAVVVAVSGGSDSLALLWLLKAWRDRRAPALRIVAVTVDHRLRPEAVEEAHAVAAICARWNIAHVTQAWADKKPSTGLAEAARLARYRFLAETAAQAGTDVIFTGHTMDDQAETVVMRRARAEGRGSAGMAAATLYEDRIWIVRPLLSTRRKELRATLLRVGETWIDDPSNDNDTAERVRVRKALVAPSGEVERLHALAAEEGRARAEENAAAAAALFRGERAIPGLVRLPVVPLDYEALLLAVQALSAALGGASHLPSSEAVRRVLSHITGGGRSSTVAGSVIALVRGDLWLHRERRNLPPPGEVEAGSLWDGRFRARANVHVAPRGLSPVLAEHEKLPRRLVAAALAVEPLSAGVPLTRVVSPWTTFLPGFDIPLRNAVARLLGVAPVPESPA